MPEAIQTKHLPSSKTYVRDAIKYLDIDHKSTSHNFLGRHKALCQPQDPIVSK